MKIHVIILILNLALLQPVFSAEADELKTAKEKWVLAVANIGNVDPTLYTAHSVVNYRVLNEFQNLPDHELSDFERRLLAEEVLQERERKHLQTLADYYKRKDSLFFVQKPNMEEIRQVEKLIDSEEKALAAARELNVSSVSIPALLPIEYQSSDEKSPLWEIYGQNPEIFRRSKKIDLLVGSELLRIGNYYGIAVSAWTASGKTVLWEGAATDAELDDISVMIAAAARNLALGRPWSSLELSVDPPEAMISINGRHVGVGYWKDSNLKPGLHTIEIQARGYKPQIFERFLASGVEDRIDIALESVDTRYILIRSIPSGAALRLGSLWLGRTPMVVAEPDRVMSITLEKEGYRKRTIPFYPDAQSITVPLETALVDPVLYHKESKEKLFNSIAWFSISLAPTIMLLGLNQNYTSMLESSTSAADINTANQSLTVSTGLSWGSVAVNAGLLAVVLVRLSRYLQASEDLSD